MAKPSSKPQPGKPPSKHSRAARRATSPSIDTDRSLKRLQPPSESKPLGLHHGAGVTKRKSKAKQLTHAQRKRREKGMARAEAVIEQMQVKVKKSRDRSQVIKDRSHIWEDVNEDAGDIGRARRKLAVPEANGEHEITMENATDDEEIEHSSKLKAENQEAADELASSKDFQISLERKAEDAVDEVEVW